MQFFISDLHLCHFKILEWEKEKRPFRHVFEMHDYLISKWNSVVMPDDKVFVLGDVFLGGPYLNDEDKLNKYKEVERVLKELNGDKVLVMGNHDTDPEKLGCFADHFVAIAGSVEYKRYVCTHIPIHPSQLEHRWKGNIHGHLHSKRVMKQKMDGLAPDERYINVSCEQVDFTPKTLEQLLSMER